MNGAGQPASSTARPERLPHLDALRGIAAIVVLLYHLHTVFGITLGFERGYLLVDLFFMLSGYVLARSAEPRFARREGVRSFLAARVDRLWPMMLVGAALGAAVHGYLGDVPAIPLCLLLAALSVPVFFGGRDAFPLNGPQWSLSWEIIANVGHALVLRRLGRHGLLALAAGFGIALAIAIDHAGSAGFGPRAANWWQGSTRVGFAYVVGMAMARWRLGPTLGARLPWQVALALPPLAVLLLPVLPLGLAAGDALFVLGLLPAMFAGLVVSRPPSSAVSRLRKLGALSFPLYAVHIPLLLLCRGLSRSPAFAAIGVALSFGAAMLIARGGRGAAASLRWRDKRDDGGLPPPMRPSISLVEG